MANKKLNPRSFYGRQPQIGFRIPAVSAARLDRLARLSGRPRAFYNVEALLMLMEELEGSLMDEARLNELSNTLLPRGGRKTLVSFGIEPELMKRVEAQSVATGYSRSAINALALLMHIADLEKIYLREQQGVKEALVARAVQKAAVTPRRVKTTEAR